MLRSSLVLVSFLAVMSLCAADEKPRDANSLAYLDECNPWYPHKDFPKLITPQWVGEEGVEAVIVLAIDDMRDPAKYEQYLRPILNRLKQIDGRAPVSIMTNEVKPDDAQLQSWLGEGLSIECHTIDHPCPILQGGDLPKAKSTYDRCVDLMGTIPGNKPVAFRTPCCDSLNTVSPRFFSEIFSKTTEKGNFLQIDSSVFTFFTSEDESLPKELVLDANGQERFWKYLPKNNKYGGNTHDNFVNYIKNYPYPYVINNSCWEIPCIAPSDWSAQHLQGINNPVTIEDWKAAIDLTVHKQGCFSLVFHPHGWIKPEQVVEMIDHAVAKHGNKVKFLNFKEVAERLNASVERDAADLREITLIDLNRDGLMDVFDIGGLTNNGFGKEHHRSAASMLWLDGAWVKSSVPESISRPGAWIPWPKEQSPARVDPDHSMSYPPLPLEERILQPKAWTFDATGWRERPLGQPITADAQWDSQGYEFDWHASLWRDFDGDCQIDRLIFHPCRNLKSDESTGAYTGNPVAEMWFYDGSADQWVPKVWAIPVEPSLNGIAIGDLRFPDLDQDGDLDLVVVDQTKVRMWIQENGTDGWTLPIEGEIQFWPFRRETETGDAKSKSRYSDNGFFIHDNHFCWINEDTAKLPDLMFRVSFDEVLAAAKKNRDSAAEQRHGDDPKSQISNFKSEIKTAGYTPVPIGAAVADITPEYPVRLTGYGNRMKESEGVAAKIHARALVIGESASGGREPSGPSDVQTTENASYRGADAAPLACLITVDNCGVPLEMTEMVYERIAAKHNIPRQNFAISSTHSHSAPWLRGFAPNIFAEIPEDHAAHLAQYEKELTDKLVDVVEKAIASQRPGHLSYGFGEAGFAMNRRALANGKWAGFGEVPDGPTDKRVPVLAAHDVDGKLIAVLANYACHCTTETGDFNQISGDWAGFAADMLEADHPGAVALIAIGCGADANPSPRGTHEQAKVHGRTIADEVNRLLVKGDLAAEQRQKVAPGFSPGNNVPKDEKAPKGRHISANENESAAPAGLKDSSLNEPPGSRPGLSAAVPPALNPINPDILCNMARIDLPLGPIPSRETWEQQAKEPGVTGSRARYFLQMLDEGKPIPTTIPNYPVQTWCFGDDLAMVFLGGEVVVDYSIRLNDMFDSDRLWINAYSNDVPCYIASARVLREGGYECDSSMLFYRRPTRLAPEAEDVLCDAVQKIMPHKFYSEKLQQDFPAPKSPEESLKTMTTKPDLRVVLAASEPLIRDPVAFDWDERGRLWVVEMGDYPKGDSSASGGRQPSGTAIGPANSDADVASGIHTRGLTPSARQHRGRIQMLEDTDKNGVYDKATTFLDNLAFPTGIHCWRGGVIITMAPEIFYAEDTNGDGKADVRETMYRGFVEGNQQHRINGLRWGLDGWLYLANGDSGGEIAGTGYVPGKPSDETTGRLTPAARQVVNLRGRDLRINPDTNELDAVSGQTQFGRERDDFGNWFGNNNSNPIWQYVLEDRYVRRNPHAGISQVTAPVAVVPGAAPVYPTSRTLARFNDFAFANRFTSACSTMIYRDTYLGEQYYGNAFTSEPVHNLVSRLVMTRDGYGFKGERAADEQQSEFLASSDNWFRPTMIRTGPDGAIWVADMYRAVIEHPEWIPPEYQRKMNLYAGGDMGRIYRIVPASECCGENVAVSLRRDEPLTTQRDVAKPTAESRKPEVEVGPACRAGLPPQADNAAGDSAAEQRPMVAPGFSPGSDRPNDDKAPEGRQNIAQEHGDPALADDAKTTRLISAERDGYFDQPWNEIPLVQLRQRIQSSNGWWRDTAHRILMHRIHELDSRDITALVQAATGDANEAVSVQAGSLLSTICEHPGSAQAIAARAEAIHALLTDVSPVSRRMGLQMVESSEAERPANDLVMSTLEGMTSDDDRSVRLQLALISGRIKHQKTSIIIARLLQRDFDDTVIRNAAISSLTPGNIKDVLTATLNLSPENPNEQLVGLLLGQAAAMEQQDAIAGPLIALIASLKPDATSARIDSLASTVSSVLNGDIATGLQNNRSFVKVINTAGSVAQEIALDETAEVDRRAAAIRFAGVSELLSGRQSFDLIQFLTPQTPFDLQLAAVQLMGRDLNQEVVDQVVSKWSSLDPAVRAEAMANMLKRENSIGYLLDQVEAGILSTGDLDASQRDRLINHGNARISERARKVMGEEMHSARSAVVDDFKSQISNLKSEISKDEQASAGKLVFEKRCATCHRLQYIGKEVGADLAALKDRSTDALLTAILDPNKAVESKFLVYTVVTKDGLQHSGMLKGETGGSLTLIGNDGKEITVVRANIEELVGSQRSLMPEGLEKDLSATDLANVIAFVQSTGTPWKRFDGNVPKFVAANEDGSVTLPASAAEIYGPSLIFEEKYGNLGYWLSADDYARWTFEVPKSGHWTVEFDFACDDSNAGSLIKFSTGNRMLTARVPGSGTWDNYQTWQAGTIDLHRGRGQLIITAPEKPPFALIDLRAVRLIPPK